MSNSAANTNMVYQGALGSAPEPAAAKLSNISGSPEVLRAPPGYKLIRVRKADGSVVTVKKKLSPEELAAEKETAAPKPRGVAKGANGTQTANSGTADATSTESKPAAYKVVVVRMPDGTLGKVKRPVTATDSVAASVASAPALSDPKTNPKQEPEKEPTDEVKAALHDQHLDNKRQRRVRFKNTLLHGLVGSLAAPILSDLADGDELLSESDWSEEDSVGDGDDDVEYEDLAPVAAAAVAGGIVTAVAAEPARPARTHAKDGDDKETYKITEKDLKEIDDKAAKQEDGQGRLQRRWADFSFYLMASLSIILPLLFLILTILIIIMDGESTSSNWSMMVDPIKISVTVWPIVFAAVTAQAFKTWATYKVERGIKLMELEQLVGSNSFGAVMKQPFFLRRLDILTLLIFLVWSFSPLGSQALLRVYSLERGNKSDTISVMYAPLLGDNQLLTPGAGPKNSTELSELWQAVSVYYIGAFVEADVEYIMGAGNGQDDYNHPVPWISGCQENGTAPIEDCVFSAFGVPVALPPAVVKLDWELDEDDRKKAAADALAPSENINFPIISSYYNFTCGPWKTATFRELNDTNMNFSVSGTLAVQFSALANSSTINHLRFATLLDLDVFKNATSWENIIDPDPAWNYGVIDCGFEQVFFKTTVECWVDVKLGIDSFSCETDRATILTADQVQPSWHTRLRDFSAEFSLGGSPYPVLYPYTPTERWVKAGKNIDGTTASVSPLSVEPQTVAYNFRILFNTFVTIAHCPTCIPANSLTDLAVNPTATTDIPWQIRDRYTTVPDARHAWTPPGLFFTLSWAWACTLLVSVSLLLIIGVASVVLETILVAPDVLGYASTLARNSKYLRLPGVKAGPLGMGGAERARHIGGVRVMVQDVRPDKEVGRVVLGLERVGAERLKAGRIYR